MHPFRRPQQSFKRMTGRSFEWMNGSVAVHPVRHNAAVDIPFQIPAVCQLCNRPFPSGFATTSSRRLTLIGNTSGPCPWCGYPVGNVPDGVFDVIDGAMELIERLPTTRDDMLRAAQILQDAITNGNQNVDELEARLREEAPTASWIVQLLRDPATGTVLAAVGLVLTVILYVLG